MKKILFSSLALALAAGAHAQQSNVTVYGTIDAGFAKVTDKTTAIAKGDSNRLGVRGVEDLGGGLKAVFQMEMRFEPDTGTVESGSRPLFQGQTRVGLQGDFGQIRIGRGVTAYLDAKDAFDPWNGVSSTAGFKGDLQVAGYNAQPLDPAGSSNDRFNNGLWYNSPTVQGFQFSAAIASKESNGGAAIVGRGTAAAPQFPANSQASALPFSLAAGWKSGDFSALLGYERNAIQTKVWGLHLGWQALPELKLTANYAKQDQNHSKALNSVTTAWVLGANYSVGAGKILFGYGQKKPDGAVSTKQTSLGYHHSLSKRTYVYVEASNKAAATSVRFFGAGVNHKF
ncbi:porin [Massilia sp. W12]|uniref:porin n=1 Tax=Massilia sp. W12 TaxID=3126507 RepID=UPI0030D23FD7